MAATALSDKAAVVSLRVVCVDARGVGGGHQCSQAVEGERGAVGAAVAGIHQFVRSNIT